MWDEFSGFYQLSLPDRLSLLQKYCNISPEEVASLQNNQGLPVSVANRMVENVIGVFPYPFGVALYFRVNKRDHIVPMVIEESSVIAAASKAAKIALSSGGFVAHAPRSITIGQVQLIKIPNEIIARTAILGKKLEILSIARECDPILARLGGGPVDLEVRQVQGSLGSMLIVHLLVDTKDAMGANTVNTMLETISPLLETLSGGTVCLRILSNLAIHRIATASAIFPKELIGGAEVVEKLLWACDFADHDPYRAATHNKGILNGIVAVAQATGNDTRAIEAGAHAFAAYEHPYRPLTHYERTEQGDLRGEIQIPLMVGRVGGITSIHPLAKVAWKILNVSNIGEFYEILASVGLAQNFAALLALVTEGIQKGHMKLHATNIALLAGATNDEANRIVPLLIKEGKITVTRAQQLLEAMRTNAR